MCAAHTPPTPGTHHTTSHHCVVVKEEAAASTPCTRARARGRGNIVLPKGRAQQVGMLRMQGLLAQAKAKKEGPSALLNCDGLHPPTHCCAARGALRVDPRTRGARAVAGTKVPGQARIPVLTCSSCRSKTRSMLPMRTQACFPRSNTSKVLHFPSSPHTPHRSNSSS